MQANCKRQAALPKLKANLDTGEVTQKNNNSNKVKRANKQTNKQKHNRIALLISAPDQFLLLFLN